MRRRADVGPLSDETPRTRPQTADMPHQIAQSLGLADHEHVQITHDRSSGLLCIVAVHSTALGPAMGGVRRTSYPSLEAALDDALRLSLAMTLKNSAAGLPLGGGKSVIVDAAPRASARTVDAFADTVAALGGRYVAAEDIGTTPADMDRIATRTRWVAGVSPQNNGSGDPSPSTARTVLGAIEHAVRVVHGSADLSGRRVGVIGAGKVGGSLVAQLAARGAQVLVADIDAERVRAAEELPGVTGTTVEQLLRERLDVLAPCARGGIVTRAAVADLRAGIVCGAANNILADDELAADLQAAGVLYVPDFVANAGGIVQVGGEFLGWPAEAVERSLDEAVARVGRLLDDTAAGGEIPLERALREARRRVDDATSERVAA